MGKVEMIREGKLDEEIVHEKSYIKRVCDAEM